MSVESLFVYVGRGGKIGGKNQGCEGAFENETYETPIKKGGPWPLKLEWLNGGKFDIFDSIKREGVFRLLYFSVAHALVPRYHLPTPPETNGAPPRISEMHLD